jgi:hypothetical protein
MLQKYSGGTARSYRPGERRRPRAHQRRALGDARRQSAERVHVATTVLVTKPLQLVHAGIWRTRLSQQQKQNTEPLSIST